MGFDSFPKIEDSDGEELEEELSPEEKQKKLAYSIENLGVQGEQIIDIAPEIREQLEEVHEFIDPETNCRIEYF